MPCENVKIRLILKKHTKIDKVRGQGMTMIEKIDFNSNNKSNGFEIIALDSFLKSLDSSFIKKQYRTNFYNLIFVTEGRCTHEVDFIEYTVNPGETLVISNNRVHKYCDFEHVKGYLIMFTEGFMCEFLSNQSTHVKDLFKQSHLEPHIKATDLYCATIKSLFDVISNMYMHSNEVISEKVLASTFKTLLQIIMNSKSADYTNQAQKNELFVQFTELVDKHIEVEKSVEGYAKMMHVSEKTVNQVTRNAIDVSAKQYIIKQLVQKIRLKLSFEQSSINKISDDLGFSEASNMTRFFKKNTGISPKEFRNEIKVDKRSAFRTDTVDLMLIKESVEKKVYHIPSNTVVPLHKHSGHDEVFYCIKGTGFGVREDGEIKLEVGKTFVAKAGALHSLRSDSDMYVVAVLVPVISD